MTEKRIYTLLDQWKSFQSTKPQDRSDNFEQHRINHIENIVRTFVDYYNMNYKHSTSYQLKIDKIDEDKPFPFNPFKAIEDPYPTACVKLKELVLSLLRHQGWAINDVKFSEDGSLESINIKFANKFTLGNSNNPWDPR